MKAIVVAIERHGADISHWTRIFHRDSARFDMFLEGARRDVNNISTFLGVAETVYLSGSLVSVDAADVARSLRAVAQGRTAVFVCAQSQNLPRAFVLGEGPPVTFTEAVGPSVPTFDTWFKAFDLAIITRQPNLCEDLCAVPNQVMGLASPVSLEKSTYAFIEMRRIMWRNKHFTSDPIFADCEAVVQRKDANSFVRCITGPYLEVLRALDAGDAKHFDAALAAALEGHKDHWSSQKRKTKDKSEEIHGLVSLQLCAAAALAWDRGMRFKVESDYIPTSWVRGTLFQR